MNEAHTDRKSDERLNRALEIYLEWGPRARIPVADRWLQAFPDAMVGEFTEWKSAFREMEQFAYDLAAEYLAGRLEEAVARARMAERYPQVSDENQDRLLNLALFYAMH
jgi:hypothetical protein